MTVYSAPVKDMMFLFEHLKDNKNYNEIEKYKEVTSDLVKDILEEAAKINEEMLLPLAKAGDENPCVYENGVVRTPPAPPHPCVFPEGGTRCVTATESLPLPQRLRRRKLLCNLAEFMFHVF